MLRNTAIAICLLVACASLGSYWLGQWKVLAGERPPLGWIGVGIGAILLLFAAIIALTTIWIDSIRPVPSAELPVPTVGQPLASRISAARTATNDREASASEPWQTSARTSVPITSSGRDAGAGSEAARLQRPIRNIDASAVRPRGPVAPTSGHLWGATRCVLAVRQDPQAARWTLDNECGVPVGIMLATCDDDQPQCAGGWKYVQQGMLLPAKQQRSVSQREQTQSGVKIRYIACAIEDADTVRFMALDPPATLTSAHREALDAAAQNDLCVGAVSSGSIGQLFGPGAPISPHEALIRQ
jgi:hypothetical protein